MNASVSWKLEPTSTLKCSIPFLILEVSLSTIKQWASVKGQLVPKLATLLPFLELSSNQEYLVQRFKGEAATLDYIA